jgi:hypothetical protein
VPVDHIRQISLKTFNSVSLPIFNQLTEDERNLLSEQKVEEKKTEESTEMIEEKVSKKGKGKKS